MEIFGIGPMEFVFILIIILLVVGPKDIEKFARNFGKMLNRIYKSPGYNFVRQASDELRNLPARLAREAQLDELKDMDELKQIKSDLQDANKTLRSSADKPFDAWVNDLTQPSPPPAARNGNGTPPVSSNGQSGKTERDA
jgi:Sec-independent protein translocase protein TatA